MKLPLASLARREPMVIYVDDVHWGDSDSAALLLDLACACFKCGLFLPCASN